MGRIVLLLLPTLIVIGNSMYLPLLPAIQESFAMTERQSAWVLSIFTLAGIVAIPFGLWLADRTSFRVAMQTGCGCVILGALGSVLFPVVGENGYGLFIAGRIVEGLGAGSLTALTYTYVGSVVAFSQRLRMFGFLERSNGLAKMMSPLLGSVFLYTMWSYSSFLLMGIALFCLGWLSFGAVNEQTQTDRNEKKEQRSVSGQTRLIVVSYTMSLIHLFLLYGLLYHATYMFSLFGLSPIWRGILLALPFLAMVLISSQVGRLEKYSFVYRAPMFLLVFSAILLYAKGSSIALMLALMVIGASNGLALPVASQMLAQVSPLSLKQRALSGLSMARFAGIAFAPLVYARWMAHDTGVAWGTTLLAVGAFLLVFVLRRHIQPQQI
ncbi:MFS transporter [Bacillus sp. FSL W7-1360]